MKHARGNHVRSKHVGKPAIAVILTAVLLLGGVMGFFVGKGGDSSSAKSEAMYSGVSNLEQTVVDDAIVVQTDFGPLFYPVQFQEFLRVEQEKAEDFTVVRYFARVDGSNEYEIFRVNYGIEDQMVLGGIQDGKANVISLRVNENLPFGEWDEDEDNLAYAMLEGVSYLTERLDEIDGFVRDV